MVRFVEEAQGEFLDAIINYEEARADLGQRFKDEVDRSILWIQDHPELYRLRAGRISSRHSPSVPVLHSLCRQRGKRTLAESHSTGLPGATESAKQDHLRGFRG